MQKIARRRKDPYGPERSHWYHALRIDRQHYYNLSKEQALDKKIISNHKRVIRKLQNNLSYRNGVLQAQP
jgi:hypothetical protein